MYTIFTSYFDVVKKLPETFEPIAICGGIPSDWKGKWTRIVAPKKGFFNEWKYINHDNDFYIKHFKEEVLDLLNPNDVVEKIKNLADDKIPCLICYEKPNDFCHRHLVSDWLNEMLDDVKCREYDFCEDCNVIVQENPEFNIFK